MNKKYIGYGLEDSTKFIMSIDQGGELDEFGFKCHVWELSDPGLDLWRELPWNVWKPKRVIDVFCAFKTDGNKFDLAKLNQVWFDILRKKIVIKNRYGVKHIQSLITGNELRLPKMTPWLNNLQGVNGFNDPKVKKYMTDYLEKLIDELRGLDWAPEQGNETCDRGVYPVVNIINPVLKAHGLIPWSYGTCPAIPHTGKSAMDFMEDSTSKLWGEKISRAVFRPCHACTNVDDERFALPLKYWGGPTPHMHAICFSSDGVKKGKSECDRGTDGRGRPSKLEWTGMITEAIKRKVVGDLWFEHCPEAENAPCQVATIEAMQQALNKASGHFSENRHKHEKPVKPEPVEPPVEEPPVIIPESIPTPEKPPSKFKGWWNNRIAWIVAHRGHIAVAVLLSLILFWVVC